VKRAALALAAIAATAGTAHGQRRDMAPAARAHLERGLRAYADRQWDDAIEELRAGYQIDPHPDFLFPWAQAMRLSGDCAGALPLYRRALAEASEEDRSDIEGLIAGCEAEVEREPPPAPEPRRAPRAPRRVRVETRSSAPPERSPWYTDGLGGGLAIGGAIGLAAGTGFLVAARRAEVDADSAATLDGFVAARDQADQRRLIGAVALGAGAGLAAVAVLRYAWVGRSSEREPALVVLPTPGGAAVALRAGF
jgi:hypothetical protein